MTHHIYKVLAFRRVAPFTLLIRFNDKTAQTVDFSPVLNGELFGPLRDEKVFNQVKIDRETRTLVWPNGADFDPATLHDWSKVVKQFSVASCRWRPRPRMGLSLNTPLRRSGRPVARR